MPKAEPQALAFAVMRDSMIESGMVGVGEIVFSGRQHLMTFAPPHDPQQPGMMLYTLRFAAELRDPRDYATDTGTKQADAAQLSLAKQLIDAYTQPFEVSKFKDHYEEALRELVEAKMKNLPLPGPRGGEEATQGCRSDGGVAQESCKGESCTGRTRRASFGGRHQSKRIA